MKFLPAYSISASTSYTTGTTWNSSRPRFAKAHYNYVKDGGTTYRMDNLRGALGDKGARMFTPHCVQKQYKYVITTVDLNKYPAFKDRLLKTFHRDQDGLRYGHNINSYKL